MPELPEVETIRRQLEPELTGAVVESVAVRDRTWVDGQDPDGFAAALTGREISGLARRGKYLRVLIDGGDEVIMHLRMTGNLVLVTPAERIGDPRLGLTAAEMPSGDAADGERKHLRAVISIGGGREIWFIDPRRFGRALLLPSAQAEEHLRSRLGPEPLSTEFTPGSLLDAASARKVPLKSFLLDQKVVAGIGNIYADEALYRARLHPLSPASSMRSEHADSLHAGVVDALAAGLENGGASIDDYRDARGEKGSMQDEFLVHRRAGEACNACGEEIRRIVVGGRSTYFCRACQRRLRRKSRPHRPRDRSSFGGRVE